MNKQIINEWTTTKIIIKYCTLHSFIGSEIEAVNCNDCIKATSYQKGEEQG